MNDDIRLQIESTFEAKWANKIEGLTNQFAKEREKLEKQYTE